MGTRKRTSSKKVGASDGYSLDAEILRKDQYLLNALLKEVREEAGIGEGHGYKKQREGFFESIQPYLERFNVCLGDPNRTKLLRLNDLFVLSKNGRNTPGIQALLAWLCATNPMRAEKIYSQIKYPSTLHPISYRKCPLTAHEIAQSSTKSASAGEQLAVTQVIESGFAPRAALVSPPSLIIDEDIADLIYFLANMYARVIYRWLSKRRFSGAVFGLEEFTHGTEFANQIHEDNQRWIQACNDQINPYLDLYDNDERRKIINISAITRQIDQEICNLIYLFEPFKYVDNYDLLYLMHFENQFEIRSSNIKDLYIHYKNTMISLAKKWGVIRGLESSKAWYRFISKQGKVSRSYSISSKINIFRHHMPEFVSKMREQREGHLTERADEGPST